MPLNTRTTCTYVSRLAPLHGSDNPSTRARTSLRFHANQYAHPDAPKPIHPDKEHFCSRQLSWEQTSNPSQPRPLQERSQEESKLDYPCNSIARRLAPAPLNQTGGDGRNRTDDPLLAKQVLYQLSYIPSLARRTAQGSTATKLMVGQ